MQALAAIWADMLCTYSHPEQLLTVENGADRQTRRPNYRQLKHELLHASAEITPTDSYTPSATLSLLDKLLDSNKISLEQYVELLPEGTLGDRFAFLEKIREKGDVKNE